MLMQRTTSVEPTPISGDQARKLIVGGRAPERMHVRGLLDLSKARHPLRLPQHLTVDSLDLSNSTCIPTLPAGLRVKSLKINDCPDLHELPTGLQCDILEARGSGLRTLPDDLRVTYRLDLSGSVALERLPDGLAVGTLNLRDCVSLRALPEHLNVFFLDISGCTGLEQWPRQATMRYGHLRARGCIGLNDLPSWLKNVSQLDLRDCSNIRALPANLKVNAWVDLANTGITGLMPEQADLPLRWRGVPVDQRVAFQPETISADEILAERNVERRRVLLDRMGYAAFLSNARAETIHADHDPGGERRLLKLPQPNDEDLVCLAVYCPSTGRQYIIRVPPTMRTCHQAAAWIAGYDNADDYRPIAET